MSASLLNPASDGDVIERAANALGIARAYMRRSETCLRATEAFAGDRRPCHCPQCVVEAALEMCVKRCRDKGVIADCTLPVVAGKRLPATS